jgi:RNA polymerase sigma factor (sigma-70 family)
VNVPDNQLVERSLDGDVEAFASLALRHGKVVHRYLSRRSSPGVADDLLGEVWLRAFRSRGTYDQSWEDSRPWLYGIARNVLRGHWRDAKVPGDGLPEQPTDPWAEVDESLDARRASNSLQCGLNALQPADREVLLLVAWEDLTPSEAAITLGIPSGTARWRLHRARRAFSAAFVAAETTTDSEPTSKEA